MKAKKALKRLTRAEKLLSDVLDQYSAGEKEVKELLDSAKTSVARAWESLSSKVSSTLEKKPASKKRIAKKAAARIKSANAKPAKAKPAKTKPAKTKKTKRPALIAKTAVRPAVAA